MVVGREEKEWICLVEIFAIEAGEDRLLTLLFIRGWLFSGLVLSFGWVLITAGT
jgi:hypothetical protein